MCQKQKLPKFACWSRFTIYFFKINISHDLLCLSFARSNRKKTPKFRILTEFLNLAATHWEWQAAHKTHDFVWNGPTVPDWGSRCARKTHSQHCKSSLWYPVTLYSVTTPLFKQQGRKRREENCRLEVRWRRIERSGWQKTKNGVKTTGSFS